MAQVDTWWDDAACKDTDPEVFSDRRGRFKATDKWGEARELCKSCPVQLACLNDVLSQPPVYDERTTVFAMFQAGLTPDELTALFWDRWSTHPRRAS